MPCPICITTSLVNALGLTGAMVGLKKMRHKQQNKNNTKNQDVNKRNKKK